MARHSDLPNDELHEPKGIANAVVGDAGKVLTPSSVVDGASQLRNLEETEINSVVDYYTLELDDISTNSSTYVVVPYAGTLTEIRSVIHGTLATADNTITCEIAGAAVTMPAMTVAYSGSAAGDVDSSTPTADNTIAADDVVEIISSGDSTNTVRATFTIAVQRD